MRGRSLRRSRRLRSKCSCKGKIRIVSSRLDLPGNNGVYCVHSLEENQAHDHYASAPRRRNAEHSSLFTIPAISAIVNRLEYSFQHSATLSQPDSRQPNNEPSWLHESCAVIGQVNQPAFCATQALTLPYSPVLIPRQFSNFSASSFLSPGHHSFHSLHFVLRQ